MRNLLVAILMTTCALPVFATMSHKAVLPTQSEFAPLVQQTQTFVLAHTAPENLMTLQQQLRFAVGSQTNQTFRLVYAPKQLNLAQQIKQVLLTLGVRAENIHFVAQNYPLYPVVVEVKKFAKLPIYCDGDYHSPCATRSEYRLQSVN